jgi:hypothetical protein
MIVLSYEHTMEQSCPPGMLMTDAGVVGVNLG